MRLCPIKENLENHEIIALTEGCSATIQNKLPTELRIPIVSPSLA